MLSDLLGACTKILFLCGVMISAVNISFAAVVGDINQDGKIDLIESVYALQVASGVYTTLPDSCLLTGKGTWGSGTSYNLCDVVEFSGLTYACTIQHTSLTGTREPTNTAYWTALSIKGDTGPQGPAGTSLWSDGSDGDLTINSHTNWDSTPPTEVFFDNVTIDAGRNFSVPAGTTIRCSGSFTNNGTISVLKGAEAEGSFSGLSNSSGPTMSMTSVAHPGDTKGAASMGDANNDHTSNPVSLNGGTPGKAIPQAIAISSFSNFKIGGGSGAGYDNQGNAGGGLLKVYCNGNIVNNGTISASGFDGTNASIAGGGGGIVILASRTAIDNSFGLIDVSGGNGSNASSFGGNGAGGGGGIIILASPTAPILGTEIVSAGTGGDIVTANSVTTNFRTAGAGGGGCGGEGGFGGFVGSTGTPSVGGNGSDGYVITLNKNPSMLIN